MLVAWVGCATPAPTPPLPTGLAGLSLPYDAGTLRRIAREDDAAGRLDRRQAILGTLNRQLLMAPPAGGLAPELFDFVVALAPRMEDGTISPPWASCLYTTYQRDLGDAHTAGRPRRSAAEIDAVLDGWIEHYSLRANPTAARQSIEGGGFDATQSWRNERRLGR